MRILRRCKRLWIPIASAAISLALLWGAGSCVIVDPPAQLPELPRKRPVIVSTDPPTGRVLGTWPGTFLVNVEIPDPRADLAWEVWIDYDPASVGQVRTPDNQGLEPGIGDAGVRTLAIDLPSPIDVNAKPTDPTGLTRCHTIEVVVAAGAFLAPHIPSDPGGDVAYWTFSPSGDLACPRYDAGQFADGAIADAGAE